MPFDPASAAARARADLAERLGVRPDDVREVSVNERDFPNSSLGAPLAGEMSAQMISSGWVIMLSAAGSEYEYRADKYQLRLHNYKGSNYVIEE